MLNWQRPARKFNAFGMAALICHRQTPKIQFCFEQVVWSTPSRASSKNNKLAGPAWKLNILSLALFMCRRHFRRFSKHF
jgi:hypothetical protein